MSKSPKVAVVILNWNGYRDTIACLDSLLPNLPAPYQVIVCDNDSQDGSLTKISEWASGRGDFPRQPDFVQNHATRPIKYTEYDRAQAEAGGSSNDPQLVFVRNGANLGFAGGNNVGLRYALARGFDYVWLLNNDTVVNEKSLSALMERMQQDSTIGMCGSTLVYYHEPETVQALGGARFDFKKGLGSHLGVGEMLKQPRDIAEVEKALDYVVGASMMVSRQFLEQVGLMCEDYFLYFEELDWAMRAKGRYRLAWAPESLVWHKEGGSIGSSHRSRPSATSLRYLYLNRLRFAKRFTPNLFWSVWRQIAFELLVFMKRLDWQAVGIILGSLVKRMKV